MGLRDETTMKARPLGKALQKVLPQYLDLEAKVLLPDEWNDVAMDLIGETGNVLTAEQERLTGQVKQLREEVMHLNKMRRELKEGDLYGVDKMGRYATRHEYATKNFYLDSPKVTREILEREMQTTLTHRPSTPLIISGA